MKQIRIVTLCILCLTAVGARTPDPKPSPTPSDPPKPSISVSFERQAVRENDAVQVNARFANEWDQALTDVTLSIDGPSTLVWKESTCANWKGSLPAGGGAQEIKIGALRPNEVRPTVLCARSGPSVDVGSFNVSFTYEYSWKKENIERHSFVTVEKPLSANLFGSDSIAGVPIALAAFIVPGLFFWLILGWLKFSWNVGVALGEKLIYSVLTSIPLLLLVNYFMRDPVPGISYKKLTYYALGGTLVGLAIGLVDWGRRGIMRSLAKARAERAAGLAEATRQAAKAKEVKLGDDSRILLGKLLDLYSGCHNPTAVLNINGKEYQGSLATATDDVAAIVGWFQIDKANIAHHDKATVIRELDQAGGPLDLFNLAEKYDLEIDDRNPLKLERQEVSRFSETFPGKGVQAEVLDGRGSEEALVLV